MNPLTYTFAGLAVPGLSGVLALKVPSGDDFILLPDEVEITHIHVEVNEPEPFETYEVEVWNMSTEAVYISRTLEAKAKALSSPVVKLVVPAGTVLQVRVRKHLAAGFLAGDMVTMQSGSTSALSVRATGRPSVFTSIRVGLGARVGSSVGLGRGWDDDPLSMGRGLCV